MLTALLRKLVAAAFDASMIVSRHVAASGYPADTGDCMIDARAGRRTARSIGQFGETSASPRPVIVTDDDVVSLNDSLKASLANDDETRISHVK